ncbi:MAG: T9SS type A sorting domain-containing protein [Bacteroidetes bacterium]|nr:T9SS type A sorting domain-containing protein [Bacteroidota bacterium]
MLALTFLNGTPIARAQLLWHVTHTDSWVSPSGHLDSLVCFTSVSCKGNICTAAAIVTTDPNQYVDKRLTMFRSEDGGASWKEQSFDIQYPMWLTNFGFTKVQQVDPLCAVGIADNGFVVKTTDGGQSWKLMPFPVQHQLADIDFSDSLTGIVVGIELDSEIFTTTDGGNTWTDRTKPGYYNLCSCRSFGHGEFRFFRYGRGQIYTTYDNFQTVDSTALIFDSVSDPKYYNDLVNCTFTAGDTILAYGRHWPSDTVDPSGGYGMIMRSTDGGKSWEQPFVFPTIKINDVTMTTDLDRDTIYAGGFSNHNLLVSTDRGASWRCDTIVIDTSYTPFSCWGLTMTGDEHLVASFSPVTNHSFSILARSSSVLSHVDVVEKIQYYTYVYPNPADRMVHISSIDRSNPYHVFDILGREVAQGVLSAEGTADLDVSQMPAGVYEVLLQYYELECCAGKIIVR